MLDPLYYCTLIIINTMTPSSIETLNLLNEHFHKCTIKYPHQMVPPYFQQINLNDLALSDTTFFKQIVQQIEDDRFNLNDNREYQCWSFVDENHSNISTNIPERDSCIKAWVLCKLLKLKYQSSTSIYLQIDSDLSHQQLYNNVNNIILDAYEANSDMLNKFDTITKEFTATFLHNFENKTYSISANKQAGKECVLKLDDSYVSQNILHTAFKLLQNSKGVEANTQGIVFVDCRKSILSKCYESGYIECLYSNNILELEKAGINTLLQLLSELINMYNPNVPKHNNIHIRSMILHYQNDAFINNNTFFNILFGYADFARDFYFELLLAVFQFVYNRRNHIDLGLTLIGNMNFSAHILNKFHIICKTISTEENTTQAWDSGFREKSKNIILGMYDPSLEFKDVSCVFVLKTLISRTTDFFTLAKIYENIFFSKESTYSPDYHILITDRVHSDFLHHCFMYAGLQYQFLQKDDPSYMNTYSTQRIEEHQICDISNMYYPKIPSVYTI